MKPASLSVCLPAFNDAQTVGPIVERAIALLEQEGIDYEIIVVNDGSRDRTGEILDALARAHPCVRVMHHPTNQGYGAAVRAAFAAATKEYVFYTDSDGQFDVQDLPLLFPLLSQADVV